MNTSPSLFLVVSAASPARHTTHLAQTLRDLGWQVTVIATWDALSWLDSATLTTVTRGDVLSTAADTEGIGLDPRVTLIAPATFNTINKTVAGINDSLALNVIHTAIGSRQRVIAAPHVNADLHAHPLFQRNISALGEFGVVPHLKRPSASFPDRLRPESWTRDLEAGSFFGPVQTHFISWDNILTADGARKLRSTFSNIISLDSRRKQAFLDRLAEVIDSEFNGAVSDPCVTAVYLAPRRNQP